MSPNRKLKALHIASGDLWAGAEVQLFTLLCELQRRPDIEPAAALMNEGELARRLRERGIAVTVFDERRLNGLQILRGLRRLMLAMRPDVVHTHRLKENVLGAFANALATRAPSVRSLHGAPEHNPRGIRNLHRQLFPRLDRFCGRYLQRYIIAVSTGLQPLLAALFTPEKVVIIENGIDIDAVQQAVQPVDLRPGIAAATDIGIVGRLQPVKRVDLFIDMAAQLLRTDPQRGWHFHIIGDGPLRAALVSQAEQLGIAPHITFHGHRSDSIACLAALDALVMCSDHEGMPMTVLESVAVGTPVLAHAVGGLNDVLADGAGGLLVPGHTAADYAAGMLQLLNADKASYREKGLARLHQRYSSAYNARQVAALYRRCLT